MNISPPPPHVQIGSYCHHQVLSPPGELDLVHDSPLCPKVPLKSKSGPMAQDRMTNHLYLGQPVFLKYCYKVEMT